MIIGNPITMGGGGASLNIDYGTSAPDDTTKLWVPLPQKPSAVECSPVLQYGNEYVTADIQTRPSSPSLIVLSTCYYDGKLYMPLNDTRMSIYDIATNTWEQNVLCSVVCDGGTETAYTINANQSRGAAVIDGKIYYWGHSRGQGSITFTKLYFDIATRTYHYDTSVILGDNAANSSQCVIAHGTRIYAIGGYNSGGNNRNNILYLDVHTNESGSMASLTAPMRNVGACALGNAIYIFGGYGNAAVNIIQRLDLTTNQVSQVGTFPQGLYYVKAFPYGQYIYTLGGMGQSGGINIVYRFNTADNTIVDTGARMPVSNYYAVGWQEGNECFVTSTGDRDKRKQIDKFTVDTPLAKNSLFIQCDFGFDGLWSAINDKNTVIKLKAINAFLGDSNNLAQPTAAYLHNGSNWVSLDGESLTADMLAALATLGVT